MHAVKTIQIEPGSEIDRLLDEAATGPINLERRGEQFRLNRVEYGTGDIEAGYDAQRAIAGMRAAAGSWSDIDAEEIKAYLYRAREERTRPLTACESSH